MKVKSILLLLFLTALIGQSFMNTGNINQWLAILQEYVEQEAPEKTYVQTDKPYYTNGDTIWFQAYLVDGIYHTFNTPSKLIYVDLINPGDSILETKVLLPQQGGAGGDFVLPEGAPQGTYIIRAYTQYMRNQDEAYFFQKEIPVLYQTITDKGETIIARNGGNVPANEFRPVIQFFPEGGDLVAGLPTQMGVKATTPGGQGIPVEGKIECLEDRSQITFKTYETGMGLFAFKPEVGRTYQAIIAVNGTEQAYPIPEIQEAGYILNIKNRGQKLLLEAASNLPNGIKGISLIGHFRGEPFFQLADLEDVGNKITKTIPTDNLLDGIGVFTLFDPTGEPVCERLVFIENNENDLSLTITTDQESYAKRSAVELELALEDEDQDSIFAHVSLAITDLNTIQTPTSAQNIKSWLLLNSDLKGNIENPAYYFEKPGDTRRRYLLDALLLTQGWRRFVWKEKESPKKTTSSFIPEAGFKISGSTYKYQSDTPEETNVVLTFLDGSFYSDTTRTSKEGEFSFGPYVIMDTINYAIQARKAPKERKRKRKKKKREEEFMDGSRYIDIEIDELFQATPVSKRLDRPKEASFTSEQLSQFLTASQESKRADQQYDFKVVDLEEVEIKAKRKEKTIYDDVLKNQSALYRDPNNRLVLDSFPIAKGVQRVFDLLRAIPGVQVTGIYPEQEILIRDAFAAMFLNGAPVDPAFMIDYPIQDILFIDVLKGPRAVVLGGATAAFGDFGKGGAILFYTRTGSGVSQTIERQPGIQNNVHPGFYKAREFYTPDYSAKKESHVKPDLRTTLYWKSGIKFINESEPIQFYTADQVTTYEVIVEGVTLDGRVVYGRKQFRVE